MKVSRKAVLVLTGGLYASGVFAAGCATVLVPSYSAPLVAPGWQAQLIANGFKKPRSLYFDSQDNLIVLDAGVGVRRLKFTDNGGTCLSIADNNLLINMTTVRRTPTRLLGW